MLGEVDRRWRNRPLPRYSRSVALREFAVAGAIILGLLAPAAQARPAGDFAPRADALLKRRLWAGDFSGVVLVAVDGKPVLRRGYGLADREWNIPVTPNTVFRIGSTTKQFTAAAVMQLIEAGKVKLDDPIRTYVASTPAAWSTVTVRELLDHTSGVPDYTQINGFIRTAARLEETPDELIGLVADKPLGFSPGSEFRYSNTDYVLLGMMIEKVSGQAYPDYLREHVLRPLGLNHTAYDNARDIVPDRASGYWRVRGVVKNARLMTTSAAYAAGGLRSTADDLLRWNRALHGDKLIKPRSVAQMFTDYGHGYGFGSFVETRHGHRLWDHGGNLPGFSCAFEYYPDDHLTVIVLTNFEGAGSEAIAKELAGLYFGWNRPGAPPTAAR